MQIYGLSNTNFGRIYLRDTAVIGNTDLNLRDERTIKNLVEALNTDAAQNISVYAEIGTPIVLGYKKAIRVQTSPTTRDIATIQAFRPEAKRSDYKRKSRWVGLYDENVYDSLSRFIKGQKGFIHHCTKDPDHNAQPFDNPMWRPGLDKGRNNIRKPFLGEA